MGKDNPPVYENYGEAEWFLTTNSTYEFLVSMAYLQAVMSMEFSSEGYIDITPKEAEEISKKFTSKKADSGLYTGVKFYGEYDDTVIVVMRNQENYVLMYSSDSERHFNEMDCVIIDILQGKS